MSEKNDTKKDNQSNKLSEQRRKEFEKKHGDFLSNLKVMPRETPEEKKERWIFFQAYPLQNDFKIELMNIYQPGALDKLRRRIEKSDKTHIYDLDIASYKHKNVDPVLFLESIQKAIFSFTGVSKDGIECGFPTYAIAIYKREAGVEAVQNKLQEKGVSALGISKGKKWKVAKLAKSINSLREKNPNLDLQELLSCILKEAEIQYSERDVELALRLVSNETMVRSLDQSATEDGAALKDILEDKRDYYEEIEKQDQPEIPFLKVICQNMEECWKGIESAKRLKERISIQMFLTKDILKVLKLDEKGNPFMEEPAGDEDFYVSLKPHGIVLYRKIFRKEYLQRAFVENPQNLYEVYARLLRKDFNFNDNILTELIGKDKTAVSRGRKAYRETMKTWYSDYKNNQ